MKNTLSICLISSTLTILPWFNHSATAQNNDPDAYLRRLAALDISAAHSARLECFAQRSGERNRYNQCLRTKFIAAGGRATPPPVTTPQTQARPTRPEASISLEPLGPPHRDNNQLTHPLNCPTENQCAVALDTFGSVELGRQTINTISNRFPELTAPFDTLVRPITSPNEPDRFRAAYINGSRAQARELCEAIRSANETCYVVRQVPAQSQETNTGSAHRSSENVPTSTQGSSRVQIGAFSTREFAHRQLDAISSRLGQYSLQATSHVEAVTLSDGTIRYRASFIGLNSSQAVSICNAIRNTGADCITR